MGAYGTLNAVALMWMSLIDSELSVNGA
jgi:hypothetical protein